MLNKMQESWVASGRYTKKEALNMTAVAKLHWAALNPKEKNRLHRAYETLKEQLSNPIFLDKSLSNLVPWELSMYIICFDKGDELFSIIQKTKEKIVNE